MENTRHGNDEKRTGKIIAKKEKEDQKEKNQIDEEISKSENTRSLHAQETQNSLVKIQRAPPKNQRLQI